jgi:phosphatidylglycerophosphate synthase
VSSLAATTVSIDLRSEADSWFADVCGLSTIVRLLCALQHAGVNSVVIAGEQASKAADAFKKHPLARRAGDGALVPQCVAEFPEEGDLLFRNPVVLSSATIKALVSENITEVPDALPDGLPGFLVPAKSADERRVATNAVLGSVGKPMLNSGIASVYLLQPIAKILNRPLSHTPITPNQVTILGFLLGLASLPLLWNGGRYEVILAVSLLLVANILDQIDGQLARIKFLFSSYGEKLDHYLDEIIKVLLLAPIGVGLTHATGHEAWSYIGWAASSAQLFYTLAMFYYLWRFGGKDASSTNFKFWYSVKPRSSEPTPAPAPEDPNAFKRRFLLRKDFAHTMLFVFGAANFIEAPFMLIASGAALYGSITLVQLIFFHRKVQIAGDYYGGV